MFFAFFRFLLAFFRNALRRPPQDIEMQATDDDKLLDLLVQFPLPPRKQDISLPLPVSRTDPVASATFASSRRSHVRRSSFSAYPACLANPFKPPPPPPPARRLSLVWFTARSHDDRDWRSYMSTILTSFKEVDLQDTDARDVFEGDTSLSSVSGSLPAASASDCSIPAESKTPSTSPSNSYSHYDDALDGFSSSSSYACAYDTSDFFDSLLADCNSPDPASVPDTPETESACAPATAASAPPARALPARSNSKHGAKPRRASAIASVVRRQSLAARARRGRRPASEVPAMPAMPAAGLGSGKDGTRV
ncbi:hypothetical protein FA15DRAFT_703325 [Coprinopsis marcescibilis]|uniref:Uncharacterized protein n=1 Tax=Coprinopsis marcescibilis TaxID=230819 RepID=A0A5C3KZN4_COPMA|nr:hypothetical protein FA15DRAFT_703325 [Coprinopsis marcescibilis]